MEDDLGDHTVRTQKAQKAMHTIKIIWYRKAQGAQTGKAT
jgi:hypothetical protein